MPWRIPQALSRDPITFLTNASRNYGDFVRFRLRRDFVYLLSHPDYARDILVTHAAKFTKGVALQRAKSLLGEGLLTSEGELHRRQRRLMQPAFHHQTIVTQYAEAMVGCGVAHSRAWTDGLHVDMFEEMRQLALEVVAKAMFGADIEADAAELSRAFTRAVITLRPFDSVGQSPKLVRRTGRRKQPLATTGIKPDTIIHRIIEQRRRDSGDRHDVISMLMSAVDEEAGDEGMTDKQVRDEVMTLIQAGHETTANALTWTWYLLARNPEAELRFHRELDDVLNGRVPTAEDIQNLPYTGYVFSESLRLFPPAWILARRPVGDYEMQGHIIRDGSLMLISPYVLHHDERFFPDPDRFIPERWEPESRRGVVPLSYLPFGHGPRRCIGDGFAMTEGVLLLASLGSQWRVEQDPPQDIEMLPQITLRPKSMPMVLRRRS